MSMYKRIFVSAILCVLCAQCLAKKESIQAYTPADFFDGEKTIHSRIKFPEWEDDVSVSLRCDSRVSKFGKVIENFCFSSGDKYALFEKEVHKAMKNSFVTPAMVGGAKKGVWFQYFVNFNKSGKKKRISIYPNYGLEMDRYGVNYTSPQRYSKGVRTLFNRCRIHANVWIKATIDEFGNPNNVEVVSSKGGNRCTKNLAFKFSKAKYIPAYVDGRPVPSLYMESFFTFSEVEKR